MSPLSDVRTKWKRFLRGRPGARFQALHRRRQRRRRSRGPRVAWLVAGGLVLVLGLLAMPLPGPGVLVTAAGAALLARESRVVARFADRVELRLQPLVRRGRRHWAGASPPARLALGASAVGLALACAWLGWTLVAR